MAIASETTSFSGYSPTATPVLDVVRPAPSRRPGKLTSGEYFFLSSVLITSLIGLPLFRSALAEAGSSWIDACRLALSPALALLSAFLVHEGGHLLGGLAAGFRFSIDEPVKSDIQQGLLGSKVLRFAHVPSLKPDHLRARFISMYAAGPLAGLICAIAIELSGDWTHSDPLTQFRIHLVATFNVLISLATLLPDVSRTGHFSDGARLIALFKNDEQGTRLLSILKIQSRLQQGAPPKEWDEGLITSATLVDDESRDAVAAHWLAYMSAYEKQDITSATKHLETALNAPAACSAALRQRLFLEAAIFQAWFRDNPAKARSWKELINQAKLSSFERQRLAIALLWADGKLFDAFEALSAQLQTLANAPASSWRQLAETSALDWKRQMESRMLTRAWRAMYTMSQQVESSTANGVAAAREQLSSC